MAIIMAWAVVLVHSSFCWDRRAVGASMIVGMMIFSIVGGLDCGGGQSRGFVWKLLILLGLCLLRRQRM